MTYTNIISVPELNAVMEHGGARILDCRFDLKDPLFGESAYALGHIPGAQYVHLDRDLCSPKSPQTGRHPMASLDHLVKVFSRLGIDSESQVVCYDSQDSMFAARCWWTLRYLGHEAVAVLDGGLKAWTENNFPLETQTPHSKTSKFVASPKPELLVMVDDVSSQEILIDSRDRPRFRGDEEPIDPVAGHIPSAKNLPFKNQLTEKGKLKSKEEVSRNIQNISGSLTPTFYCGSGVTACLNILASDYAGIKNSKLYLGSWSEWIRDPHRPVAKGD